MLLGMPSDVDERPFHMKTFREVFQGKKKKNLNFTECYILIFLFNLHLPRLVRPLAQAAAAQMGGD